MNDFGPNAPKVVAEVIVIFERLEKALEEMATGVLNGMSGNSAGAIRSPVLCAGMAVPDASRSRRNSGFFRRAGKTT